MLAIFLLVSSHSLASLALLQGEASDFQDLGKMLVGGFILAVGAGVAFTVVRLRLREKKPMAAQIISISSPASKEE